MTTRTTGGVGVVLAFAAIYVIWGTTFLGIALIIQTVPPFISGALRFVTSAVLMYAWLRLRTPRPLAGIPLGKAALSGVLLSGIGNGFVIWAQQGIPSGIAALMTASVPALVLLIDWAFFTRRAPSPGAVFATAVALTGVIVIVAQGHSLSGHMRPMHMVALVTAILCWSFGTLVQRQAARPESVLSFACAQMFFAGVFQLLMSVINNEWHGFHPGQMSWLAIAATMYMVVFGSLIALNSYLWLLTRVAPQKVTTYALVNPVIALVLGAIVLHESIGPSTLLAAVLVLAGVAMLLFERLNPVQWLWNLRSPSAQRS